MKEAVLAYTAGLIDGEGTITLSRQNKKALWRCPIISCSSTSYELLQFLKDNWGGSISKHKTYQDHHKQSWSWKLCRRRALAMLHEISPYMLEPEKVRRSRMLLDEYLEITPRNGKYSEDLKLRKASFELRFLHPSNS